jgi:hypothetical protein
MKTEQKLTKAEEPLDDKQLDDVAGGLNPQPLPPLVGPPIDDDIRR